MNVQTINIRSVETDGIVYYVMLRLNGEDFEFVLTKNDTNGIATQVRAAVAVIQETSPGLIKERIV